MSGRGGTVQVFRENAGLLVGGYVIFALLVSVASQPSIAGALVAFPLAGRLYLLILGLIKGPQPELSTLFAGFAGVDRWVRWLGIGWLLFLYQFVAFLIALTPGAGCIGYGIYELVGSSNVALGATLITAGSLLTLLIYPAIAVRSSCVRCSSSRSKSRCR